MKRDINLMNHRPKVNTYIILISLAIVIAFLISGILIPLNRKKRSVEQADKIAKEIMEFEIIDEQYKNLENHYKELEKKVELLKRVRTSQHNIIELIDIIDDSISSSVELTNINISGEILEICGKAPKDEFIAAIVDRLSKEKKVLSARIQETILDKKDFKKMFSIKCITPLAQPNLETLLEEEEGMNEIDGGWREN